MSQKLDQSTATAAVLVNSWLRVHEQCTAGSPVFNTTMNSLLNLNHEISDLSQTYECNLIK